MAVSIHLSSTELFEANDQLSRFAGESDVSVLLSTSFIGLVEERRTNDFSHLREKV